MFTVFDERSAAIKTAIPVYFPVSRTGRFSGTGTRIISRTTELPHPEYYQGHQADQYNGQPFLIHFQMFGIKINEIYAFACLYSPVKGVIFPSYPG